MTRKLLESYRRLAGKPDIDIYFNDKEILN